MVKLLTSPLWQQMNLLDEPAKEDVRIELIDALASELVKADTTTVRQTQKAHRLNDKETDLLMELLHINYILEVSNGYNKS